MLQPSAFLAALLLGVLAFLPLPKVGLPAVSGERLSSSGDRPTLLGGLPSPSDNLPTSQGDRPEPEGGLLSSSGDFPELSDGLPKPPGDRLFVLDALPTVSDALPEPSGEFPTAVGDLLFVPNDLLFSPGGRPEAWESAFYAKMAIFDHFRASVGRNPSEIVVLAGSGGRYWARIFAPIGTPQALR